MDTRSEYNFLVKSVKDLYKTRGEKLTNEQIANKLAYSRTHFSGLLGGSKEVTKKHVDYFKSRFADELSGFIKPAKPGDPINRERAIIKALIFEVASLKALIEKVSFDDAMKSIRKNTNLYLSDLEIDF